MKSEKEKLEQLAEIFDNAEESTVTMSSDSGDIKHTCYAVRIRGFDFVIPKGRFETLKKMIHSGLTK